MHDSDYMRIKNFLKTIAVLAAAGTLFSGYLTYLDFAGGGGFSCVATTLKILGLPVCVYGLAMYIVILALAIAGIYSKE